MKLSWEKLSTKSTIGDFNVLVLCVIIVVLRSNMQFLDPDPWAEELIILARIVDQGIISGFAPVSGQFIPFSIIPAVVSTFFPLYFPWIMAISSLLFITATISLVLFWNDSSISRTSRRGISLATVLVPIYPEPFGVGLYNFWWAALWPIIAATHNVESKRGQIFSGAIVIVASFSSLPGAVAGTLWILLGLKASDKNRVSLGFLAIPGLVVQIYVAATAGRVATESSFFAQTFDALSMAGRLPLSVFQWQGAWPNTESKSLLILSGALLLAFVAFSPPVLTNSSSRAFNHYLAGTSLVFLLMSTLARPNQELHPLAAGPRYYHLGWTVLMVALVLIALNQTSEQIYNTVALILLSFSVTFLVYTFERVVPLNEYDWAVNYSLCQKSGESPYIFRSQEDGYQEPWKIEVDSKMCR